MLQNNNFEVKKDIWTPSYAHGKKWYSEHINKLNNNYWSYVNSDIEDIFGDI